jgi:two-component system chemotaxis sensor kinase CheA
MNEFLELFLVEGRELVEQATSDLLMLEGDPSDPERLDSVFRAFHTLKGGAGIVNFPSMSRAMHAAEDILSAVRTGDRPVTQALIGDCLTCLDQVVKWLDTIQDSGDLPAGTEADVDDIVARFTADSVFAHDTKAEPVALTSAAIALVPTSSVAVLKEQLSLLAASGDGAEGRMASAGRLAANVLRHLAQDNEAEQVERTLLQSQTSGAATLLTAAIERAIEHITQPAPANAVVAPLPRVAPTLRTLRIAIERVNDLVNVTGELIVAKNAVGHIAKLALETNNTLAAAIRDEHARLDHLIESLQSAVRGMRVLPLRVVFQRFSRLVREMSESLSKPVRLVTEGEETEADKAIVEMLFEPLLHVVRNAMDHGVEPPEQRAAAGKPSLATLSLRARRDGEHVVVECEDDGSGIDVDKIRKVVAERHLVSLDVLSAMSDIDVINLIFLPGFSTARDITDVSGRGVGMGAVRTAVERLRGRVLIETRLGKGSMVRFILPFSVMMTRVLMVEIGQQIFGIPLDAVVETLCIRREQIHPIGSGHAFVLRNLTIPLIELSWTLDRGGEHALTDATIVVVASSDQLVGLQVDRLGMTMDVMLRPPGGLLSGMPGIAGTAMLGNGSVLLVLSLQDMLQ